MPPSATTPLPPARPAPPAGDDAWPEGRQPDWTRFTDDPVDAGVHRALQRFVQSRTEVMTGGFDRILERFENRTVLDIGVAEHDLGHYQGEGWKHRRIRAVARRCVGVDILPVMVERLRSDGFDVHCVDATSDHDLGDRFERVHVGDVIEHVADTARLLRFAARHLAPGGEIVVGTPNPYFHGFVRRVLRERMLVANFEHVGWIGETHALELARREGLVLARILRPGSRNPFKRAVQRLNPGLMCEHFWYVFVR